MPYAPHLQSILVLVWLFIWAFSFNLFGLPALCPVILAYIVLFLQAFSSEPVRRPLRFEHMPQSLQDPPPYLANFALLCGTPSAPRDAFIRLPSSHVFAPRPIVLPGGFRSRSLLSFPYVLLAACLFSERPSDRPLGPQSAQVARHWSFRAPKWPAI